MRKTNTHDTFNDIFALRSENSPSKIVYRVLKNGEEESEQITFRELYERSAQLSTIFLERLQPGDRVLLLYPTGIAFIEAYLACLLGGIIAVPVNVPTSKRRLRRIVNICKDCTPALFLGHHMVFRKCDAWFDEIDAIKYIPRLATDKVLLNNEQTSLPTVSPDQTAFLQYTSGSTGMPKGVMISHQNLMHNLDWIKEGFGNDENAIVASWLPVFHDLGLIGNVLQGIYAGCETILMTPVDFVRKPIRWLQAITQYQVTTSGGPNFAYDLCIDTIKDEELAKLALSSWKFALNGAEVIRHSTLKRFSERFSEVGFRPESFTACYGLAEATLLISAGKIHQPPATKKLEELALAQRQVHPLDATTQQESSHRTLVGCGRIPKDFIIKIVDPESREECAVDQIGEIWVASASNAKAYWNKTLETDQTFHAFLAHSSDQRNTFKGPFLRTGDMGFLDGEELYISGRLKEMMIINGQNYFPQDIEQSVQDAHPDLAKNRGAAFSVQLEGKEQLIITQEVKRTRLKHYHAEDLFQAISKQVFADYDLPVSTIVLLQPAQIPLTSSGKIQRLQSRQKYLEQTFSGVLDQWKIGQSSTPNPHTPQQALQQNERETTLINQIKEILGRLFGIPTARLNADRSFAELGLNSIQGVQLIEQLSQVVGKEISPTVLYDYFTIQNLARHLSEDSKSDRAASLVNPLPTSEAIAIISMACRFPSAANTVDFWENLVHQADAITTIPSDRWPVGEESINQIDLPTQGGFLDQVEDFDAAFFNISPGEAKHMDPQQRLLLEVSYELFENAGYPLSQVKDSSTGVFIGISQNDYSHFMLNNPNGKDLYTSTGGSLSIAANRLSYFYHLNGPSLAIDTACSSSLVAVHTAVQSIQNGNCSQAIAGGVNLLLNPEVNHSLVQANMLSKDGRCKTFDDAANGYVRSEGCGLVLLKSLSAAQADGDQILALIKGGAVNQDGRSNGLTAPNGLAQQQVIRQALSNAQTTASAISYVETHGTGTPLGDPIEVNAINAVYSQERSSESPLVLGAVKANIGHLESAAGIAGLIKTALCLQHQAIPGQPHLKQLNPVIDWPNIPIQIPVQLTNWTSHHQQKRMAGLSSFGFGGTNAHLILEEAPPQATPSISSSSRTTQLFLLSANDTEALKAQAQQLIELIQQSSELSAETLAYNLAIHRTHFSIRLAIPAQNLQQLQAALVAFVQQQEHPLLVQAQLQLFKKNNVFLFTGGGAQYAGMGKALYQQEPSFAKAIDQCAAIALHYLPIDLRDILFAEPDSEQEQLLHRIDYMQPALFAFEYAACQLWMEWGVSPQLLIGHSLGEIVAACIGGLFALEDGIRLICSRGKLMQSLPPGGAMMSVQMDAQELQPLIKPYQGKLAIGVINGPQQTVLSGEEEAILDIQEQLEKRDIKTKRLQVSHASHSPLMQPILEEYRKVVESIDFRTLQIPLVSNLSGQIAQEEIATPDYWLRHLRKTVRFAQGVQQLEQSEMENYIELGPHPVLLGIAGQCIEESSNINWLASARREEEFPSIYHSLAKYFVEGGPVNWKAFFKHQQPRITLPNYPFQRKRFWLDSTPIHSQTGSFTGHPLLGNTLSIAGGLQIFETTFSIQQLPFLDHHQVYGQTIIAGAVYCEMIQAAISQLEQDYHLAEILTHAPVLISEEQKQRIQLILDPPQQETIAFTFYQLNSAKEWVSCASGNIQLSSASTVSQAISLPQLQAQYPQAINTEAFYENFASLGIHYGPLFRGVKRLWKTDGKVLAQLQLPEEIKSGDHDRLHPVLLDSAFQLAGQLIDQQQEGLVQLLYSVEGYQLYRAAGRELWVELESIAQSPLNSSKIRCWDTQGQLIAQIEGLHVKAARPEQIGGGIRKDWLYQLQWTPVSLPPKGQSLSSIITGDQASDIPLLELLNNEGQYVPQWQEAISALVASQAQQLIVLWASSEKDPAQAAQQLAIQGLQQLQQLVQFQQAGRLEGLQTIWWITSGVHSQTNETGLAQSTLWGLARSFQQEHPEIPLKLLDREEDLSPLVTLLNSRCDEQQLAMIEGQSCGLRLRKWATQADQMESLQQADNYRLEIDQRGVLEDLRLRPISRTPLKDQEVEIEVHYAGLNFRDVLSALGLVDIGSEALGGECSGTISRVGAAVKAFQVGDQVMAVATGTFTRYITVDHRLVARKPQNISLAKAATLPITFLTAWWGLKELAALKSSERILIHAAAGGVGMAAVQIAHYLGAKVYATASPKKQSIVKAAGVAAVFNSRDLQFHEGILKATKQEGVDVVLNSLTDEFVDRSLDLLQAGGRFLEIGKRDIRSNEFVQEHHTGVRYMVYDIARMMTEERDRIQELFHQIVPLFEQEHLQALPLKVFPISQAQHAFQYMSRAQHIGKILLAIPHTHSSPSLASIHEASATLMITGGLGALGIEISKFIAAHYTSIHLLLLGRNHAAEAKLQLIERLSAKGANIQIESIDITDRVALAKLIAEIPDHRPLKGILHAAAVLDDGVLTEQSPERFQNVMQPKIQGIWNLHELTKALDLDLFVLFSSVAATIGSAGQSNYAAANAFLDVLTSYRMQQGLPIHNIIWGPWAKVGLAAQLDERLKERIRRQGFGFIKVEEGIQLMNKIVSQPSQSTVALPLHLEQLKKQYSRPSNWPTIYQELITFPSNGQQKANVISQLKALPIEQRRKEIEVVLQKEIAKVLSIAQPSVILLNKSLKEIGLDSLRAIELKNNLAALLQHQLPSTFLFDYPTVKAMGEYLEKEIFPPVKQPTSNRIEKIETEAIVSILDDYLQQIGLAQKEVLKHPTTEQLLQKLATNINQLIAEKPAIEMARQLEINELSSEEVENELEKYLKKYQP